MGKMNVYDKILTENQKR